MYSDPEGEIDSFLHEDVKPKTLSVIDDNKVAHKLWRLSNAESNQKICDLIRDKKIYIADGHHRYKRHWLLLKTMKIKWSTVRM